MYKWVGCMLLICLFILSGCMNSADYKEDDVAVIVRGEEITVGDLRFLYPGVAIVDMIDEVVKAKLVEQEVKKMNIDISKQVKEIEESFGEYPQGKSHSAKAESIRAFADPPAKELGIDPKDYYEKYTEISVEKAAYINVYTSKMLGELEDNEFGIEEYIHHANELLDDLVERNKEAIKIRIK